MNNIVKTIIGLIIYLTMPVILGVIIVGAIRYNNWALLVIIFVTLIVLSVGLSIYRFIKNKR